MADETPRGVSEVTGGRLGTVEDSIGRRKAGGGATRRWAKRGPLQPQPGHRRQGRHFLVWDEERAFADAWASDLAQADPPPRSERP